MARGPLARLARPSTARGSPLRLRRERGAALLVVLAVLGLIVVGYLVSTATGTESEAEKQRRTADALAQAKAALIGYALAMRLTSGGPERPGDLPCPDDDGDGSAELQCGQADGSYGGSDRPRLGRLPWRTLGLPDLRDGDGERLWYAVSNNYKNNVRTTCGTPVDSGCLNSDTRGTITVYDRTGNAVHLATNVDPETSGAIAIVIAPGAVLERQGVRQNRDAANANDPRSFLDIVPAGILAPLPAGEDNAGFADGGSNGFIDGPVRDASGNPIVNDRIIAVRYSDLMPLLEARVAREVQGCLDRYAASNGGRYPGASPLALSSGPSDYADTDVPDVIGRIPDEPFAKTATFGMASAWSTGCTLGTGWWKNWKSQSFYAIAEPYKPGAPIAAPPCTSCLRVNPPSAADDKSYVVILAGRRLAGQQRDDDAQRATIANYLEGENDWVATPNSVFAMPAAGSNDRVVAFRP